MNLLLYSHKNTFAHSLDPRAKIFFLIVLFTISMLFENHILLIVTFMACIFLCLISQCLTQALSLKIPMLIISISTIILWSLFYHFSPSGIHYGIAMAIRLNIFILGGVLYLSTTSLEDFTNALINLNIPYRVGFTISLAFRLFPTFVGTAAIILQAQKARGLDLDNKNPIIFVKNHLPLLVPIFICAIRQADILAMALETRGFGSTEFKRTTYYKLFLNKKDIITLITLTGLVLIAIIFYWTGYLH